MFFRVNFTFPVVLHNEYKLIVVYTCNLDSQFFSSSEFFSSISCLNFCFFTSISFTLSFSLALLTFLSLSADVN